MADNVAVTPGSGATMRTDDVGGVQVQAVKIVLGADGVEDCLVDSGQQTMANSVPVAIASNQTAVAVSAASLPLPSGAATEATLGGVALETGGNLATIAGDTTSLDTKITACDTTNVTVGSSALPTGAATESTLSTLNGKVTACNTGAVTISAALPTGANTIGSVKLTDGVTETEVVPLAGYNAAAVAIVDGAGAQITSFGGGTQYTEADTDASITGTAVMWEDAADTIRAASATYPLPVEVIAGATSGTEYTEGDTDATINGFAIMWEDAADTLRAVSAAKPLPVEIAVPSTVPVSIASVSANMAQETGGNLASVVSNTSGLSNCVDGAGSKLDIADGGGSITVDGTVAVTDGGGALTVDASNLDIRQLNHATGDSVKVGDGTSLIDIDVAITDAEVNGGKRLLHTESWGMVYNGTTWDRMRGTVADGTLVNLGSNNDVTVTGTVTANLAAGTNTNEVVGDVAHSAAAAGNPVLTAGVAQAGDDTAPPNRVDAEGDATRFATDFDGALYVRPHGPQVWSYHSDGSTALTDATVHAAPAAGLSIYVGSIVFSSGAATAINMFFEEGSTKVLGPYYLEATAGRGMSITFNPPKKISAATALTVTTSAAIAHSVDVTGFIGQG